MIYRFIIFLSFCTVTCIQAQPVNLVPNGGFEERDLCIYNDSYIEDCYPWFNPGDLGNGLILGGTPDLFHTCAVVNEEPCPYPEDPNLNAWLLGVPTNALGCEDPYEGNGYAGAFFFIPNIDEPPLDGYREYLAVRINETMQAGVLYNVSMQVSLAERSTHAIWNFQVLFSPDSILQENTEYLHYEPQLNGIPGDYIDNKEGWRELSWEYIAEGGEDFMYIGNFQAGSETDTIYVLDEPEFGVHFWNSTYYFIDDVRVSANTLSSLERMDASDITCFPNPVSDILTIEYNRNDKKLWHYSLMSIHGKLILSGSVYGNSTTIECSGINSGIYFLTMTDDFQRQETRKIIKQ